MVLLYLGLDSSGLSGISSPRGDSSATVIDQELFITGGWTDGNSITKSTEFISLDSQRKGPDLLKPLFDHCVTLAPDQNSRTVMVIGGGQLGFKHFKETYYLHVDSGQTTLGPDLNFVRRSFGCTTTSTGLIVVAGGYDGGRLASVEILDGLRWIQGTY